MLIIARTWATFNACCSSVASRSFESLFSPPFRLWSVSLNVSSENLCLATLCSTLSTVIYCACVYWGLTAMVVVEQGGGKAFPNLPIQSQSFCGLTSHLRGVAFASIAVPLLEVEFLPSCSFWSLLHPGATSQPITSVVHIHIHFPP